MDAIKFELTVDATVVNALPRLRPFLGRRVELTAREAVPVANDQRDRTLDNFLVHRLKRPRNTESVDLEDMEQAIIQGALSRGPGDGSTDR